MAKDSKIEWTHHTFNPWRGCTKVSEGCKHCYAETLSKRNPNVLGVWGPQGTRVMASEAMWREPLKWNEEARKAGERHRVFCASLADVFEGPETCSAEAYQVVREARVRLFDLIAKTPNLDWLLLTKRPENWDRVMLEVCQDDRWQEDGVSGAILCGRWYGVGTSHTVPANVWLGTSVENQVAADRRIPELLKVPAAVRFLSCEPLLGPVNLDGVERVVGGVSHFYNCLECDCPVEDDLFGGAVIHWVIAGGESGSNARPMHPDWARSLRDQCQSAGVAFFFKQYGEYVSVSEVAGPGDHYRFPDGATVRRVGKKNAGRLLSGRTWDELPTVEASHA